MKKFLCISLSLVVFTAILFGNMFLCYATSAELLQNPSFEDGIGGWSSSKCLIAAEDEITQDNDGGSLFISNREVYHASMRYALKDTVLQNGSGKYEASAWLRLAAGEAQAEVKLAFAITDNGETTWQTGLYTLLSDTEWTQLTVDLDVTAEDSLTEVKFYFVQRSTDTVFPDVYLDNCSFVKIDAVVTPVPTVAAATPVPASDIKGADKIRVGVIRWDAYTPANPNGTGTDVGGQVAKALNPEKYRSRAPFYSIIDDNGQLDFPEYTMGIWEKEADYAIDAGIDYFAYCWYLDSSPMSLARKYHTQSTKNKDIQMCAILGVTSFGTTEQAQLFSAMKEDYYLKVDDMPLVYIYGGLGTMDEDKITELRNQAAKVGLPALYVVSMVSSDQPDNTIALSLGYDALSFYSYPISNGPLTYKQLAEKAETRNAYLGAREYAEKPVQMIPSFTTGRDVRPRIDNPPSWVTSYGEKNYAELGTAQEIADHMTNILNWTASHTERTVADCVIGYAWNEHDEGGWLCPTIQEDSNGKLKTDAKGNFIPDTSRLDAIKTALTEFRKNEASGNFVTEAPVISATPASTITASTTAPLSTTDITDPKKGSLLFVYIGIPVVLFGAGAVLYMRIKKKKPTQ